MKHQNKKSLLSLFTIGVSIISVFCLPLSQSYAATSPLIFGTNLTLNNASDQFDTSAQTLTTMQNIHVQVVRMPIRSATNVEPDAGEITAMQNIKKIGAVPLIIIHWQDNVGAKNVIQKANSIFGSSIVYYEYSNERDGSWNGGFSAQAYTQSWNQYIAPLKPLATNGKFGGPVNYQSNPAYIAYFYHNANPKPDYVSWHEYTCGNGVAAATCTANISHWAIHISAIKSAIQQSGDTVPPLWVTEWNYDPNNPAGDPRATPSFEDTFTKTALQELSNDGITGATHYVVTGHTEYNLVNPSGQATAEGTAFGQMYTQLIGAGGNTSPSPTVPAGTSPTVTGTGGNGNGTQLAVTLLLHGLGSGGDNANATSKGTQNPKHTSRPTTVTFLNSSNQPAGTVTGTVSYNQSGGNFTGTLDASAIPAGTYLASIKTDGFLSKSIGGTVTINAGQLNTIPSVSETAGDVNSDNQIDILDYNAILSCFGSKQTSATCLNAPDTTSPKADIDDDGIVTGSDYNLLLRELSVQKA